MLKISKILNLMTFLFLFSGCNSYVKKTQSLNYNWRNFYKWNNDYKNDKSLAGIFVSQTPRDGDPLTRPPYINKHPAEIDYVFWDGREFAVVYFPDGSIWEKKWLPYKLRYGDWEWNCVDFNYGSDPKFKHHSDPRKNS